MDVESNYLAFLWESYPRDYDSLIKGPASLEKCRDLLLRYGRMVRAVSRIDIRSRWRDMTEPQLYQIADQLMRRTMVITAIPERTPSAMPR